MGKRNARACLLLAAACLWLVAPAVGQHDDKAPGNTPAAAKTNVAHSADDGHESPNLFTGDLGNIFWSLLTFGLVIFFLGRFAWQPLLRALQKREDFIRESLAQAKKDREEAEARLKEYGQKIADSRHEASAIVEEGRRDAEVVRQRIENQTRNEADAMVVRAKRDIEIARDTAVSDIYRMAANLATDVAGRILGKELSPEAHRDLIEESIRNMPESPSRN